MADTMRPMPSLLIHLPVASSAAPSQRLDLSHCQTLDGGIAWNTSASMTLCRRNDPIGPRLPRGWRPLEPPEEGPWVVVP